MGVELDRPPERTAVAEPAPARDGRVAAGAGVSRSAALLRQAAAPRAGIGNRLLARQLAQPAFLPGPGAPSQIPAGPQRGVNPADGMAAVTRRLLGTRPAGEAALRRAADEWATAVVALIRAGAAASGAPHAQVIADNEAAEIPAAVAQYLTDFFGHGAADRNAVRECHEALVSLAARKEQEVRLQFHHNVIVETEDRGRFGFLGDLSMLDTALTGMPDQHVWGAQIRPLRFRREGTSQPAGAGGQTDPPTSTITLYDRGMQAGPYSRSTTLNLPGFEQTIRHEVGHMVETGMIADARLELFRDIMGWKQYSWHWISVRNAPHANWAAERARLCLETEIADDALDAWLAGFTLHPQPMPRSDTRTHKDRSYVRSALQGDHLHSILTAETPQGPEFEYALTAHNDYLAELYTFALSRPFWLAGKISTAQKAWWRRRVFGTPSSDSDIMRLVGMAPEAQMRFSQLVPGLFTWQQINDAVATATAPENVA